MKRSCILTIAGFLVATSASALLGATAQTAGRDGTIPAAAFGEAQRFTLAAQTDKVTPQKKSADGKAVAKKADEKKSAEKKATEKGTEKRVAEKQTAAQKTEPEAAQKPQAAETTEVRSETTEMEKGWDLWGPFELRAADPEPLGELEVKNIVHYGTASNGEDDATEYEFELEYGIAPNHELILATPLELGDGAAEGNGDLELGWHWRLWEEKDWVPAFALRNILLIPSGYESSGVDWTFKGLFTKSIIPNKWRVHFNPYLKVAGGENGEEAPSGEAEFPCFWRTEEPDRRDFQWGFIVGTDYRLTDNVSLILDYIHESSDVRGWRNQRSMEAGVEWKLTENQGIGLATNWGMDGDHLGENWGFTASYVLSFDVPAVGKH
jgi:hypothetical protein